MNDNDDTRSYNQLQQDNEQQGKELERLTLEVETLKAFERNRSQAYHSKPVVPEVDKKLARFMFMQGEDYGYLNEDYAPCRDDVFANALAEWNARQEGVVDLGDV